jgi:hypothetical protein
VPVAAKLQLRDGLKLTVPPGVVAVPAAASDTVAVQSVEPPTLTVLGTHETDVDVERFPTVHVKVALPEAPVESFALTVTLALTAAVGVPEISPVLLLIDSPLGKPVAE